MPVGAGLGGGVGGAGLGGAVGAGVGDGVGGAGVGGGVGPTASKSAGSVLLMMLKLLKNLQDH